MKKNDKANDVFDTALGNVLRKHRTERRMSMDALAERVGLSKQSISLYERGKAAITVAKLEEIGKVFGIKYYDLMYEAMDNMKSEAVANEEV